MSAAVSNQASVSQPTHPTYDIKAVSRPIEHIAIACQLRQQHWLVQVSFVTCTDAVQQTAQISLALKFPDAQSPNRGTSCAAG